MNALFDRLRADLESEIGGNPSNINPDTLYRYGGDTFTFIYAHGELIATTDGSHYDLLRRPDIQHKVYGRELENLYAYAKDWKTQNPERQDYDNPYLPENRETAERYALVGRVGQIRKQVYVTFWNRDQHQYSELENCLRNVADENPLPPDALVITPISEPIEVSAVAGFKTDDKERWGEWQRGGNSDPYSQTKTTIGKILRILHTGVLPNRQRLTAASRDTLTRYLTNLVLHHKMESKFADFQRLLFEARLEIALLEAA